MKTIDLALQPITGYLISITRNTVNGWYELEIGIPKNWVFEDNNEIKCEVLNQSDAGMLIKISPKNSNIFIDDLVEYVEIIVETNDKIAEKERQFTDKMEEMKTVLEQEAKKFYKELDELKENSFKHLNDSFVKNLNSDEEKKVMGKKAKSNVGKLISLKTDSETISE